MGTIEELGKIILNILSVENVTFSGEFLRMSYNPSLNLIRIKKQKDGLTNAAFELAHECYHAYQNSNNELEYPQTYSAEMLENEALIYKYEFERNATSFGVVFTAILVESIYKKKLDNCTYEKVLEFWIKPYSISNTGLSNIQESEINEKFIESYNLQKEKWEKTISIHKSELQEWYNS